MQASNNNKQVQQATVYDVAGGPGMHGAVSPTGVTTVAYVDICHITGVQLSEKRRKYLLRAVGLEQ